VKRKASGLLLSLPVSPRCIPGASIFFFIFFFIVLLFTSFFFCSLRAIASSWAVTMLVV
jgi:hypothetical protein